MFLSIFLKQIIILNLLHDLRSGSGRHLHQSFAMDRSLWECEKLCPWAGEVDVMDYSEATVTQEGGSTFQKREREEATQPRAG